HEHLLLLRGPGPAPGPLRRAAGRGRQRRHRRARGEPVPGPGPGRGPRDGHRVRDGGGRASGGGVAGRRAGPRWYPGRPGGKSCWEAQAMATVRKSRKPPEIDYPDSDGKPVAETPIHRDNLLWSVHILQTWFQNEPMVYVSGNMFMYYVRGDNRRHVAP